MKYAAERPYSAPEKAARRLMQHAHAFEIVQDGRISIEKLNGPFLFGDRGTPEEVCGWPRAGHRTRLARTPRQRNVREVHAIRRRPVRLMAGGDCPSDIGGR
jgi:hypothetical protein